MTTNNRSSLRRSMRLKGLSPQEHPEQTKKQKAKRTRTRTRTASTSTRSSATKQLKPKKRKAKTPTKDEFFLPRTRENEIQKEHSHVIPIHIIGVDEAGRGPLAGPVVAAAAIIPTDIAGVTDSKKLTKEEVREDLYEKIVSSPNAKWAIAFADASRIDEINILQATMEAMSKAVEAVISLSTPTSSKHKPTEQDEDEDGWRAENKVSSEIDGCYVISGMNDEKGITTTKMSQKTNKVDEDQYYALVDGNRIPKELKCEAEPMVKGDSREYAIAAASILAKVSRDRLMHQYNELYPEYELAKHKGYPTAVHMAKVKEHGASPIHRRTFAPLKHMTLDENGNIVEE